MSDPNVPIVSRDTRRGHLAIALADGIGRYAAKLAGKDLRVNSSITEIASAMVAASGAWRATLESARASGYSHLLGGVIGLHADEAAALEVAWRGSPRGLREQRETLATEIAGALDTAEVARERWFEGTRVGALPSYDTFAASARAALAAFDVAHPEIKTSMDAERAAQAAQHMWD